MNYFFVTIFIGIGATAVIDLWTAVRKRLLGVALPNYGLVGRWIAHMTHGQFRHGSIAASAPIRGEYVIGWAVHYLTGVAFAAVLVGVFGTAWIQHPAIGPALAIGVGTVAAPFLLMQPGMGAGIAACRTPRPAAARLQSLITHAVFGLGLYAAGWAAFLVNAPI